MHLQLLLAVCSIFISVPPLTYCGRVDMPDWRAEKTLRYRKVYHDRIDGPRAWLALETADCAKAGTKSQVHMMLMGTKMLAGQQMYKQVIGPWVRLYNGDERRWTRGHLDKFNLQTYKIDIDSLDAVCFWKTKGEVDNGGEDEKWLVKHIWVKYYGLAMNYTKVIGDCEYGWMYNNRPYCLDYGEIEGGDRDKYTVDGADGGSSEVVLLASRLDCRTCMLEHHYRPEVVAPTADETNGDEQFMTVSA